MKIYPRRWQFERRRGRGAFGGCICSGYLGGPTDLGGCRAKSTTGTCRPNTALTMKHRPGAAWKRHVRTHGPEWSVNGCRFVPVSDGFVGWSHSTGRGKHLHAPPCPVVQVPQMSVPNGLRAGRRKHPLIFQFQDWFFLLFRVQAGQKPAHSQ